MPAAPMYEKSGADDRTSRAVRRTCVAVYGIRSALVDGSSPVFDTSSAVAGIWRANLQHGA
jgi:hypothetical protein